MQVVDQKHQLGVAVLRVAVGIIFLTAGLEKLILQTDWSAAGFLQFASAGSPILGTPQEGVIYNPTHDFWVALGSNETLMPWLNMLVAWGQVGIGVSLILGLFTRFGSAMGTLMMLLFWLAAWDFEFGIVNQHLTYALVTFFLGYIGSGNFYGLDGIWGDRVSPAIRRWIFSGAPYGPRPAAA